jgi:TolB-like protein
VKEFLQFRLDAENQCLWREGERVTLTPKAFSVLQYLVDRAGRLVTQNELLEGLWPDVFVQPEVLKSHILEVRNTLGDDARHPVFIETQPRRGYRFIADVREQIPAHPQAALSSDTRGSRPTPEASIAVLPFANMSGDKESDYFGDGLAEEIINALARISGLKVISRTSAFAFKGQNRDIRRIAEALGVANLLEGGVRKAGSSIRITAQLIAACDGSYLWSGRYDRELTASFAVQEEISEAIAEALQAKLGQPMRRTSGVRPPVNPEAYQAYLEGRYFMYQVTPTGMVRALDCYQRAIRLDPNYALPHAAMAERAYYQALYLSGRPREIVPAALVSLGRALQLDPEAAEAHRARAVFAAFYEYNWSAAGEYYTRAQALDPASARVRASSSLWYLSTTGRLEEALQEIRRAVNLDPLNHAVRNTETWVLTVMGKEEAVDRARAALQLFPSHWISSFIGAHPFLAHGLHREAAAALENGLEIVPHSPYLLGVLALARACQGQTAAAEKIRDEMEQRAARELVPFLPRAYANEACGDMDRAYQLFHLAIEEREPLVVPFLTYRRARLVADTRLRSLLQKMNLL